MAKQDKRWNCWIFIAVNEAHYLSQHGQQSHATAKQFAYIINAVFSIGFEVQVFC